MAFFGPPHAVGAFAHAIEESSDDFLSIPKMKVEIARADSDLLRDVIGRDMRAAALVEDYKASLQNPFSRFGV